MTDTAWLAQGNFVHTNAADELIALTICKVNPQYVNIV